MASQSSSTFVKDNGASQVYNRYNGERGQSPLRESNLNSSQASMGRSWNQNNLRSKCDAEQLREKEIDERRQLQNI